MAFVPRIASRAFGVTESKCGVITQATSYTMRNANGVTASVTDFGATLHSLMLPDKDGALADCVLGFDDVTGYAADDTPYFGCIVGRVANRIAKGKFSLGGTEHTLAINNEPNTLHGGPTGYNKQLWKATPIDAPGAPPAVAMTLQDPDGHEGYPGDVAVSVTYTLTDDNELKIDMQVRARTTIICLIRRFLQAVLGRVSRSLSLMKCGLFLFGLQATTSAPTPLNLANHTYWNLDGSVSPRRNPHQNVISRAPLGESLRLPPHNNLIPGDLSDRLLVVTGLRGYPQHKGEDVVRDGQFML